MPKRSAEEKIIRYQRKIRKLEAKKKQHSRIRRPLDSSDDDDQTPDANIVDATESQVNPPIQPENIEQTASPVCSEAATAEVTNDATAPPAEAPAPPAEATATTDVSLDPELLSALGASTSDTPEFGANIHDSLANLWTPLLKKGLPKEDKDKLTKEYLIPGNCKLLQSPKLNAEITAAVSEIVRGRDKKLVGFQQQLGTGTAAVNKAMDTLLKTDNKILALKYLSDSCRIFSDLHYALTKDRTKLITPSLEKNFLHVIQDTERDDTLFGNTLSEKIKASKAIEKQGSQIRKVVTTSKTATPPSSSVTRPAPQGNWSGPPRYSSNRGGRGGQRKPAPAARRPYPPTQAQPQAKSSNQPKTRAPMQQ